MRTDFGQRLLQARKHAKLSQIELSEAVGMSQGTYGALEREGQGSSYTAAIARKCGVNGDWLADGVGEMLTTSRAKVEISGYRPSGHALILAMEFDKIPISSGSAWATAYGNILQIIASTLQSLKPEHEQPRDIETQPAPLQEEPAGRKSRV